MITLNVPLQQVHQFLVIFLRVTALLFVLPMFESDSNPLLFKVGLAFSVSLLLVPLVHISVAPFENGLLYFTLRVTAELSVGALIGLSVRLFFAGIQMAGQIAGFQMGIALANVVDPTSNTQMPFLAQFKNLFAMLIFLSINAHHWFIKAVVESFHLIPPFDFHFGPSLFGPVMRMAADLFVLSVKIGAPLIVAMLLTSVALGIIARTVPQLNIFIVAMPLKILIGFIFLAFAIPFIGVYLVDLFAGLGEEIHLLMHSFH
jgi:flagellar biosynthetic protein FliR